MIEGRWIITACWIWVCAGEIADVISGGTPSTSDLSNFTKDGIPWLTPADLSNYKSTYIERGARDISEKGLKTSSARILPKGTVLFTSRAPIGYCAIAANEISTNQGFKSLILSGSISPEFVRYYLLSAKAYAESLASGSTFKELSGKRVESLEIPLPPLNEQRRIVAKIEALRARSQWVKEAIAAIPPLLDQFRQSVLAAAFRGDLTADWREKNPDVEPASVLLDRIRAERRRRWEEAELEKMKADGKTPKDNKWKSKYKEPISVDSSHLPSLPDKWCWVTLDELMHKIVDGTHHTPTYVENGVAFLSVKDIRNEKIYFDECKYISQEQHEKLCERCHPEPGDLLITKSGTIGRCAVVETKRPFSLFVSVALLKPATSEVLATFVLLAFQAWFQTINVQNDVTGSAIKNFHLIDFRELALPLPPLKEQHQIIAEAKALMYRTKAIQLIVNTSHNKIDQLDQSILAKAFRGELVPQDPNDEPASMLLERIKAERVKREAEAKAAKNTDKTTGRRSKKAQQPDSNSTQLELPGLE